MTRPGIETRSPGPVADTVLIRPMNWVIDLICRVIRQMSRVFTNDPGDRGSIPGRVMPKTQKMVLDASLLNSSHYKVRIKGKVG